MQRQNRALLTAAVSVLGYTAAFLIFPIQTARAGDGAADTESGDSNVSGGIDAWGGDATSPSGNGGSATATASGYGTQGAYAQGGGGLNGGDGGDATATATAVGNATYPNAIASAESHGGDGDGGAGGFAGGSATATAYPGNTAQAELIAIGGQGYDQNVSPYSEGTNPDVTLSNQVSATSDGGNATLYQEADGSSYSQQTQGGVAGANANSSLSEVANDGETNYTATSVAIGGEGGGSAQGGAASASTEAVVTNSSATNVTAVATANITNGHGYFDSGGDSDEGNGGAGNATADAETNGNGGASATADSTGGDGTYGGGNGAAATSVAIAISSGGAAGANATATGGSGEAGSGASATATANTDSPATESATAFAEATPGTGYTAAQDGTAAALASAEGVSVLAAGGYGETVWAAVDASPDGISFTTSSDDDGTITLSSSATASLPISGSLVGSYIIGDGTHATTLQLPINSGGQTINSLTINTGSTLDITNNHMIFADPGGTAHDSTYVSLLDYVKNGEIISSAGYSGYGVGLVDGNDSVSGTPVSANTIEVAYTLYGDANLDGNVDISDFNILAPHLGGSTTLGWEAGDFNYDGVVSIADYNLLAGNFGSSDSGTDLRLPAADYAALDAFAAANGLTLANVPEPASASLLFVGVGMLAQRRRCRRAQ